MAVPDETLADTRYTRLTGHAVLSKGQHTKESTAVGIAGSAM